MNSSHRTSKVGIAVILASFGVGGFCYQAGVPAHAASPVETAPSVILSDQALPTSREAPDLVSARAAVTQHNFPVALDYLNRQLARSPGDGDALALLAKCVRTMADQACRHGDQMEAEALLSQLSATLQAAHEARFKSDAPTVPLNDVDSIADDIQQISDLITASADEQAGPHIDAAMRLADEAHHQWYTCRSNDRDKVRDGLRELRWVHDRGPALSKDLNGRYYQALDQLKSRVADSEWEPLLAEAGYARTEVGQ